MKKFGIIFDMDGTLWDSAKAVAQCWSQVIRECSASQRVITEEEIKSVMGMTMDKLAKAIFPELPEDERMSLMEKCFAAENAYLREHGALLYDNLEETLEILCKKYSLYIVSNCQSGYIEAFLEHYGLESYFEDIECYGNNNLKKGDNIRNITERNGLAQAVYVGDIQADYEASCEAGVGFIHAAYGFGTMEQKVPAIQALDELPEALQIFTGH